MKIVGFDIHKGFLRCSILEGTKSNPMLVYKERRTVLSTDSIPDLMDWFESTFEEIIVSHRPNKIGYRLSLEPKKEQLHYLSFPYAILNLICHKRKIPLIEFTSRNFVPSKFGLPKETILSEYCDEIFGKKPPHWDNFQKNSLIAAWLLLED